MLILLVEDSAITAMALASELSAHGHTIAGPFATADEALAFLKHQDPDAAILDVRLRGSTSQPVAENLLDRGVPFCFLTGYSDVHELSSELRSIKRFDKPVVTGQVLGYLATTAQRHG